MCGIVGAVAQRDVVPILLEGLKRLEYRGYDSAGISIIKAGGELKRVRTAGKVEKLIQAVDAAPVSGCTGIAHTRWATHGVPCEANAHPHLSGEQTDQQIAVVHNGIIENYCDLREHLANDGYAFSSQTDTETIGHAIHQALQQGKDLIAAVRATVARLEGAYALGIIHSAAPGRMIAVRCGSPLVVGVGLGEHFIASDHLALLPVTQRFIYLEEGDVADVRREGVVIYDAKGHKVERAIQETSLTNEVVDRGHFRHFMQKEIFEQPKAISETLEGRLGKNKVLAQCFGERAEALFPKIERVQIVACGTSFHAGMIARYWLEAIAGIPCQVEIASEFRYRSSLVQPGSLLMTLSQSGETADTLAALRLAKQQGYAGSLAICNVPESSLVRESDLVFMTRAGTEIGVASTKAFTTQLAALLMLTIVLGRHHRVDEKTEAALVKQLKQLPRLAEQALETNGAIKKLSERFAEKQHALFLGRGTQYPVAMEGALKLKEISYIHAEAYPAGELKHGPLALVDKDMPVIAVAPNDELLEKLKSNLNEVKARGGELIVFADKAVKFKPEAGEFVLDLPSVSPVLAPIVYTIPLQLLAYHVAILKGTDVDQPRNLAKSVTVE